jgi:hypothetical protein
MADDVQTRRGACPAHGLVEGTRAVPKLGFPFIVNAVRRTLAQRQPYRCPDCGAPLKT